MPASLLEWTRGVEAARRSLARHTRLRAAGLAVAASLGTRALASWASPDTASADAWCAALVAGVGVGVLALRRTTQAAAVASLDRRLGTEAFGAVDAGGSSELRALSAREAVDALGGRDAAGLVRRDAGIALLAPALGLALLLVLPILAPRRVATPLARSTAIAEAARLAVVSGEIGHEGDGPGGAASAVAAAAGRAASATGREERAAAEVALVDALREWVGPALASEPMNPAESGRLEAWVERARWRLERRASGLAASGTAGPAAEARAVGDPSALGGPAGSGNGVSGEEPEGSNPSQDVARSEEAAVLSGSGWPERFDGVVRDYFARIASRRTLLGPRDALPPGETRR